MSICILTRVIEIIKWSIYPLSFIPGAVFRQMYALFIYLNKSLFSYSESTVISFMPDASFRSRMNGDPVVKSMLEEDETAYCSWKTLNLFIGSWNVNGRQDPFLKLDDWIRPPKGEAPADICVFGWVLFLNNSQVTLSSLISPNLSS